MIKLGNNNKNKAMHLREIFLFDVLLLEINYVLNATLRS
jgi:hypothetical protein